ncbi:MAG: hypothetical protein H7039_07025 [Bryobacteraceae bacterium]|nr:hypothetical protein [Bryobacteraceae bacterium]
MAKQQPAALVFAGPVSRGSLIQLPGLQDCLGWVKSSSIPTASRAVHALGCGKAVRDYRDLSEARMFLISVPESSIGAIVQSLASSELSWQRRTVILFDSEQNSSALLPLQDRGAFAASLNYHNKPEQFLAEGSPQALRQIRGLTAPKPLIVLRSKDRYLAAIRGLRDDFYPGFGLSLKELRASGLDKVSAERTAAVTLAESARVFLRAGHRLLKPRQ